MVFEQRAYSPNISQNIKMLKGHICSRPFLKLQTHHIGSHYRSTKLVHHSFLKVAFPLKMGKKLNTEDDGGVQGS